MTNVLCMNDFQDLSQDELSNVDGGLTVFGVVVTVKLVVKAVGIVVGLASAAYGAGYAIGKAISHNNH